jgi:DNA (cytosine-5)-methyltransferase 1
MTTTDWMPHKLTVGSLFAGIGGMENGLERTGGFETQWQVEIDPYAQAVLKKHWPDCGRWDDVRTFPPAPFDDWKVDLICGGFPCQDVSVAGRREGITGSRSGLWFEYARIIRTLHPRFILVENVAGLLDRGMGRVLGELAESGYDAEWISLSASEFGADHERERVYVLAYPSQEQRSNVFYSSKSSREFHWEYFNHWGKERNWWISKPSGLRLDSIRRAIAAGVFGVADGVQDRVELRCGIIGNAVVPQVAQWIGERILEAEMRKSEGKTP